MGGNLEPASDLAHARADRTRSVRRHSDLSGRADATPALRRVLSAQRIASLDLLRGIAAFSVAVPHFFMYVTEGRSTAAEIISVTGVEVFFVLSGFVLAPQILFCVAERDWRTLRTFLVRRWMRTMPPYVIALTCISMILGQLGSGDFYRYFLYVSNLWRQHNTTDYYPIAWSLSVEEWFYLVFPIFLIVAVGLTGRRDKTACFLLALLFAGMITIARAAFGDAADWGENVRRVVVFRIDAIAYGFVLFLVLQRLPIMHPGRAALAAWCTFIAAGTLMVLLNLALWRDSTVLLTWIHPFMSAGFGSSAIWLFVVLNQFGAMSLFNGIATYLGRISYSVYLFHLVILYALWSQADRVPRGALFCLYIAATIGMATAFYRLFERPILASRPRYARGQLPAASDRPP
jgi:peptidoglycan/LPS O-acetylase OafA/YrhL